MSLQIFSISIVLLISSLSYGRDFELKVLRQAERPMFDLNQAANKTSYYDFVRTTLGPTMQQKAPRSRLDNETELTAGRGVSVRLSPNHYNIHVNFPNAAVGGRSYGWTQGRVGDWSDAMYLDRLAVLTASKNEQDLARFYELLIRMVGASDPQGIDSLSPAGQHVATNFLAIYSAEAYRAMVPDAHMNWDDALLETSLLGAFHGGQTRFTKFYLGHFSDKSKMQGSGVYAKTQPGPTAGTAKDKVAQMRDYWQFSANPSSKQSGINVTRFDFEKMGATITKYERNVARNPLLERISSVVGGDKSNVIKAISQFFTTGRSKNIAAIAPLAKDVSTFLINVHSDANKITDWIQRGE